MTVSTSRIIQRGLPVPFLHFALPDVGDEEIAAVAEVINSGWVTTGSRALAFERAFAEYMGGDCEALAVNSATAGLHLSLEALGIGPGDQVITSTMTFTATAEVIRYLGADPLLVDIDPTTLNFDIEQVRAAISPRVKAIIPVHFAGLACAMAPLIKLSREYGIPIVEDAAHALPTSSEGILIGRWPTATTVFSFYANKPITTGEGGMIITRDPALAKRMQVMRLHGMEGNAHDRFRSTSSQWRYEIIAPGFKYNLTDMAAAMGLVQLRRLGGFHKRRQYLATRYRSRLSDLPLILPAEGMAGDLHAWHLYVIRLLPEVKRSRDEVITFLAGRGIGTSVHYMPLHRHPYWRDRYELKPAMFPQAESAFHAMVSLPLYTRMTDADQDRVIMALREALA